MNPWKHAVKISLNVFIGPWKRSSKFQINPWICHETFIQAHDNCQMHSWNNFIAMILKSTVHSLPWPISGSWPWKRGIKNLLCTMLLSCPWKQSRWWISFTNQNNCHKSVQKQFMAMNIFAKDNFHCQIIWILFDCKNKKRINFN